MITDQGSTLSIGLPTVNLYQSYRLVGSYTIGGNWQIGLTERPHWLARLMARWLLDWRWQNG